MIELAGLDAWPDDPVYRGQAQARRFFEDWRGAWSDLQITTDTIEVDDEAVLASFTMRARGALSGIDVTLQLWQVSEMGLRGTTRLANYSHEADARADYDRVRTRQPRGTTEEEPH